MKKVYLGSDHGGFDLKEVLREYIRTLGYEVVDYGTYDSKPVDYPDIAYLIAEVVSKNLETCVGIMIDGAGIASAMVANKVPGIRAAVCWDEWSTRNSREHNNANVLTLGGRAIGVGLAQDIVKIFLSTEFGGERHERRVNKIMDIEKRFLKSF